MAMDKIIGDAQSFVSQFTGVKSTKSHRAQNISKDQLKTEIAEKKQQGVISTVKTRACAIF